MENYTFVNRTQQTTVTNKLIFNHFLGVFDMRYTAASSFRVSLQRDV
jgi:hypothetical protein